MALVSAPGPLNESSFFSAHLLCIFVAQSRVTLPGRLS